MIVKNFKDNCADYESFQIWDVENMDAFLNGNGVFVEIFNNEYKMPITEFNERRDEISQSNMEVMETMLDQIGDKHFYIFTYHSDNHSELVHMQDNKIMTFGIDINHIDKDHVYIVIMDKK
jgi:hypothetical protein